MTANFGHHLLLLKTAVFSFVFWCKKEWNSFCTHEALLRAVKLFLKTFLMKLFSKSSFRLILLTFSAIFDQTFPIDIFDQTFSPFILIPKSLQKVSKQACRTLCSIRQSISRPCFRCIPLHSASWGRRYQPGYRCLSRHSRRMCMLAILSYMLCRCWSSAAAALLHSVPAIRGRKGSRAARSARALPVLWRWWFLSRARCLSCDP